MNAALLLMSSAWMVGADAAPAPAASPAPVVANAGCNDCSAPCGDCGGCSKPSLLDRLRARIKSIGGHRHKGGDCCEPACPPPPPPPSCCAPPACSVPAPCDVCADPCGGHKAGFLDRLRGRLGGHKHQAACCDLCGSSSCANGGCATPAQPGTTPPAQPADPPKDMPKAEPKSTSITLPAPIVPVTPVSAPTTNGATSPY